MPPCFKLLMFPTPYASPPASTCSSLSRYHLPAAGAAASRSIIHQRCNSRDCTDLFLGRNRGRTSRISLTTRGAQKHMPYNHGKEASSSGLNSLPGPSCILLYPMTANTRVEGIELSVPQPVLLLASALSSNSIHKTVSIFSTLHGYH